ncbi:MAG: hypothetical protein B6D55_05845 [Candidatus Omnitrophica bacterium 4484_70.2]|nr:MAG: hypothetical protein B6D55_05845 [Candidatus Omnitrophica bacterium 4484_70.2]
MEFFSVFVPLLVAIDPLGVLPLFVTLTSQLSERKRKTLVWDSIIAGFILAGGFLFLGRSLLKILGIKQGDFLIAGGVILFILGVYDLVFPEKRKSYSSLLKEGVVPLGVPLIVGPAVLTVILLLVDRFGIFLTFLSLIFNLLLTGILLVESKIILKFLGKRGIKILSKLMSLILSALGVRLIREGISILLK